MNITQRSSIQLAFLVCLALPGTAFCEDRIEELRVRANQGDPIAQFQLAGAYDQGRGVAKNLQEAAAWCLKAAEQGYAPAQNCIGSMHQFGDGVAKDFA